MPSAYASPQAQPMLCRLHKPLQLFMLLLKPFQPFMLLIKPNPMLLRLHKPVQLFMLLLKPCQPFMLLLSLNLQFKTSHNPTQRPPPRSRHLQPFYTAREDVWWCLQWTLTFKRLQFQQEQPQSFVSKQVKAMKKKSSNSPVPKKKFGRKSTYRGSFSAQGLCQSSLDSFMCSSKSLETENGKQGNEDH